MLNSTAPVILRKQEYDDILSDIAALYAGGGITLTGLVFVDDLSKLPTPVLGVITLAANTCYYFTTHIDLLGSRLECAGTVCILGTSSETASVSSTGLVLPLITTNYTLDIRNISFTANTVFDIDGLGTAALDWTAVNFVDCQNIGLIQNFTNFVYDKGAFLNSSGLIFDGTAATIAINNSLLSGQTSSTIVEVYPTAVISRRFRITYSSIVVPSGSIGIKFDNSTSVPTESYILDTVNFSGVGTYLQGVTNTSNKTLFIECKGIPNTAVNGQMYMQNNAIATTITNTTNFFKVAGITIPNPSNEKYSHSNNRLINDAVIERRFFVTATLSFAAGTGNVVQFAFYNSVGAAIMIESITSSTANASGRAESIQIQALISHKQGDFIEVWCRNTSATINVTVENLNVIIIES